jgi:hypothetical protein
MSVPVDNACEILSHVDSGTFTPGQSISGFCRPASNNVRIEVVDVNNNSYLNVIVTAVSNQWSYTTGTAGFPGSGTTLLIIASVLDGSNNVLFRDIVWVTQS